MLLLRIILIFVCIYLIMKIVQFFAQRALRRLLAKMMMPPSAAFHQNQTHHTSMSEQAEAQSMVPCASCGLFVPTTTAIYTRGLYFCESSHRDQYLSKN